MVQAIDNRTDLTVRLVRKGPHPRLADWDRAEVDVLDAEPVVGYADLMSRNVGQRLLLAVPRQLLADAVPGATVRARAGLASGEAMAESRPAPGTFAVEPPG
ncbi:hypothetical protein ADL01_36035 [Streptomyces sp. NRRL WC-3618]|uniref:hypothetical protein n=1 Tax=Streptomyces sp. NRRL WC-3618 TaxID=1519490 RepID=UPI0006AF9636|nr:hypothetical protein [Streptomyces sp. NRRL WC-3618]KOV59419.1 hypothetical protein ADL01_36035 [Streptomyces sp. NRRL WC-3618]